jgi:hypothetical protein
MSDKPVPEWFKELQQAAFSLPSVMSDPVPFRVLLLTANGVDNPKGIAEMLGVKPPTAMFQLRRLQKERLLKYGEKEGKIQHYMLNLDGLARMFCKTLGWKNEEISKNTHLRNVISEAFKAYGVFLDAPLEPAKEMLKSVNINIEDFVREFQITVIKSFTEIEKDAKGDSDWIKFRESIEEYYKTLANSFGTRGELEWRIALEKVGMVKRLWIDELPVFKKHDERLREKMQSKTH